MNVSTVKKVGHGKMGIQISYSAAERFLLSSMSWYLHYLLRLRPIENGSALLFGSAIDVALNKLLIAKKNNVVVTNEDIKDEFRSYMWSNNKNIKYSKADLDETLLEGILIPDETVPRAFYSLLQKGCVIIDSYIEQVLPRIKTVHQVQYDINLTNASGDSFLGVIDLIATLDDNKIYILDNKTSSKRYKPDSVQESEQLATYFDAMKDSYNLAGAGYIVIPKTIRKKKEPKCEIEIILGETKEELIAQTYSKYDQVLNGIKNAQFTCSGDCQKSPWGCCYKNYCSSGGTDLTGLKFQKKK